MLVRDALLQICQADECVGHADRDALVYSSPLHSVLLRSVLLISFDCLLDGHAATALGVERQTGNGEGWWHLLVAWNCGRDRQAEGLKLDLQDGATITFDGWSAAD